MTAIGCNILATYNCEGHVSHEISNIIKLAVILTLIFSHGCGEPGSHYQRSASGASCLQRLVYSPSMRNMEAWHPPLPPRHSRLRADELGPPQPRFPPIMGLFFPHGQQENQVSQKSLRTEGVACTLPRSTDAHRFCSVVRPLSAAIIWSAVICSPAMVDCTEVASHGGRPR